MISFLDNHNYVAKAGEEDNDDAVPEVIRSKEQFQRIMRKRKQLLNRVSKLKRELNGVAMDIKTMPILVENVWAQGTERTKEEDPFRAKNKTEVELNEGWLLATCGYIELPHSQGTSVTLTLAQTRKKRWTACIHGR